MSHALLAPSGAHRWTECTASVMFIEANKDSLPPSGGVHADEGTAAHEMAKGVLTTGQDPIGENGEMIRHVMAYVDFCRSKTSPGATVLVEQAVPLFYDSESKGTVDYASILPLRLDICDLKYGAGVSVEAVNNKQLAIYAMSVIVQHRLVNAENLTVGIHIFQPRDRNNPEPVRSWELTGSELARFCANEIATPAAAIRQGKVEFRPDPEHQCRWCPAKGICKALATYGLNELPESIQVLETENSEKTLPPVAMLTREQRIRVIRARKALEKWLEAVEDQEIAELANGAKPMGYKLVEGKANRVWTDETQAFKFLSRFASASELRPPERIISPAAAEKLLAGTKRSKRFETRWNQLITKPQGKPTLVPVTDKRPALDLNPTKMLDAQDVI